MSARVDRARSISAHIDGAPVFVKQLPITRSEEAAPLVTRNHTGLPFVSHYGIGSPGHGVGRELAAHQLTSAWVRSGEADFFPLLLGWRIIDLGCDVDFSEFDGDSPKCRWGALWPQVEKKLAELKSAPTSMVLFLEYVPETLGSWLRRSVDEGTGETVFAEAVDQIIEATAWMEKQGFHHFDVHPGNILNHEGRLLFTDFGLSLHRDFDLTPDDESSLVTHQGFDLATALMHLFHWTLFELGYASGPKRLGLLRAAAADPATSALEPVRAALGGKGAGLIAERAGDVVSTTEMFAVLMQDAFGTRYEGRQSGT